MSVNYIPKGYQTATPYLITNDAARAIDFYQQAFAAKESFRIIEEIQKRAAAIFGAKSS